MFRIRCQDPGSDAFLTPGSGISKKSGSRSGIRIRDEQHGWYFLELKNHFFALKFLNSLMQIRDPGWKKFGLGIRDGKKSDPGSGINIPDPQYWSSLTFLVLWKFLGYLSYVGNSKCMVFEPLTVTNIISRLKCFLLFHTKYLYFWYSNITWNKYVWFESCML